MDDLSWLTDKDVEVLYNKVKLTNDEKTLLNHMIKGRYNDAGIMMEMCISRNKFYELKASLKRRIIEAAVQS